MSVHVKAYAKLNLTLGIDGVIGGYHMLDSLVCSVDLYDLIVLKKRRDGLVRLEMRGRGCEFLPPEQNNAYKAALSFIDRFKTNGADIKIYKNIPLGAGLGGSSADASGVLNGMARLYGIGSEKQLKELADGLGSDTGYMISGGYARLSGRGETVQKIDCATRLNFILLCPENGVSTAECYRRYDSFPKENKTSDKAVNALLSGDTAALGENMFNELYAPSATINPDVKTAFEELAGFSPLGVNMTGSGSGVFALFENAEFCAYAKSRYRGKFECIQLKTIIPKK